MQTLEHLQKELRSFIVSNFLFGEANGLTDTDSLMEERIVDSTGILELVSFLEEHFGITVEPHELIPENLDCVAALTDFVFRKLDRPLAGRQGLVEG
jgi:acyl carrier protein